MRRHSKKKKNKADPVQDSRSPLTASN